MGNLTQKDEQGNWSLKGVKWSNLYEGQVITKEVSEKLYGALWKLMEYESTEITPEQAQELKERNTAKTPEEITDAFGDGTLVCPSCRNSVINYFNRNRAPKFCMICGQRLKWEEK